MRKISIVLALAALCNPTSIPSDYIIRNRGKIPDPSPGKIPKQKAQFGKPPRNLHNRGIGNGQGRKNR